MNTKRLTCYNDTHSYLYGLTFRSITFNTTVRLMNQFTFKFHIQINDSSSYHHVKFILIQNSNIKLRLSGPIYNYQFQQCSQLRGSLNFISPPQCKYVNFHISKIFIQVETSYSITSFTRFCCSMPSNDFVLLHLLQQTLEIH